MPNTKSAKKRLRQNHAQRDLNRARRTALRGKIRKVREAVTAGDKDTAAAELKVALRALDRAAARGLVHLNKAARTKSRLNKLVKNASAGA